MQLAQLLLVVVVSILTLLLVFVGIQVVFILRDIKKTINKANKILEDANVVTSSIAGPIAASSGNIFENIKNLKNLVEGISQKKKVKNKKISNKIPDDMTQEEYTPQITKRTFVSKSSNSGRFFKRAGRPLTS